MATYEFLEYLFLRGRITHNIGVTSMQRVNSDVIHLQVTGRKGLWTVCSHKGT
jgi:hypothetical protein